MLSAQLPQCCALFSVAAHAFLPFQGLEVVAYGQMAHILEIGQRELRRLRRRIRRIKEEVRLLQLQGALDPGRNLMLLWRQIHRRAAAFKALIMKRKNPDDPHAMVTVPVRPRLPGKSGSAAVDPYEG
jgi:hypothetical protein